MQPWERSTNRKLPGGWADPSGLPQGPNGRALRGWRRLEAPKGRRTFCSGWRVREWKIRSDAGYPRSLVCNRGHGVRAVCALDTIEAFRRLKRSRGERRKALPPHWGLTRLHRSSLWDAGHILPAADGGGECGLENIRTLCLRCHRQATFHLRARRVGKVYSG